jgi:hypothetical protein
MWQPYPEAATSLRTRQEIEVGDLNCHADHAAGTPLDAEHARAASDLQRFRQRHLGGQFHNEVGRITFRQLVRLQKYEGAA